MDNLLETFARRTNYARPRESAEEEAAHRASCVQPPAEDGRGILASLSTGRRRRRERREEPEDDARRRELPVSFGEPAKSFSGSGRAYSLPPSPTTPLVSVLGTPSRRPPPPHVPQSAVGVTAEPAPPLYHVTATNVSGKLSKEGVESAAPPAPSSRSRSPVASGGASASQQPQDTAAVRHGSKSPLTFKDSEDYARWLSGDGSQQQQQQEQLSTSREQLGGGFVSSGAPSPSFKMTKKWTEVCAEEPFLVTTDKAVLNRWRRHRWGWETAEASRGEAEGERPSVGTAALVKTDTAAVGGGDSAGTVTRERCSDSHSPTVQPAGERQEHIESAEEERARLFQAHFHKGRVHPKPPWRICADFADNHEHPYYVDWLDDLWGEAKKKANRNPGSEGRGTVAAPRPERGAPVETVTAFYKAAVEAKRGNTVAGGAVP